MEFLNHEVNKECAINYYVEFYNDYSSDADHEQIVYVYKEYRNGINELLF
jgi:transcription termination factor NusB